MQRQLLIEHAHVARGVIVIEIEVAERTHSIVDVYHDHVARYG